MGRHLHSSLAPTDSTHAILAPATTTTTTSSGPLATRALELGLSIAQFDTLDCTLQERGVLVTTVVFLLEVLLSNLVAVLISYLLELELLVTRVNPCGLEEHLSISLSHPRALGNPSLFCRLRAAD